MVIRCNSAFQLVFQALLDARVKKCQTTALLCLTVHSDQTPALPAIRRE